MASQQAQQALKDLLTEQQRDFLQTHTVPRPAFTCRQHSSSVGTCCIPLQAPNTLGVTRTLLLLQIMSNPQLHQLAAQIKTLRRIQEQGKSLCKQQSTQIRPSPWSISLTHDLILGPDKVQPYVASQAKRASKKAPRTPTLKPPAKRPRCTLHFPLAHICVLLTNRNYCHPRTLQKMDGSCLSLHI